MSRYLPLHLKWHFTTKEGRAQFKSLFYRIYFNIFGIFLGIPILPISINFKSFWFWRRGEEIGYIYPWARKKNSNYKYVSLDCCGEFNSLAEIDTFWKEYYEYERNNLSNAEDFKYEKI